MTVLVLRLIFWMNPSVHALLGLSRVRLSTYLLASFLAYIPTVVAFTLLGNALFVILRNQPMSRWIELAVAVALAVAATLVVRALRRRAALRPGA